MDYPTIKAIHMASAGLSYALFFIRGVWMIGESPWLRNGAVRIVPHVVDTVLLASAIVLAVLSRQYPIEAPWLTAKVTGLVAYVALGTVALKRGRTRGIRIAAWAGAQLVFLYIVSVALTRSSWGPLALQPAG